MDKPYKIIWRFKNENHYVQYHMYIFVGMLHGLDNVFKKIEKLTLTDTLLQLSQPEMLKIVEYYVLYVIKYNLREKIIRHINYLKLDLKIIHYAI